MRAGPRRVLFATSNGTGLGHLNRAMAIARRLPEDCEPTIFTLSQAAPVVAQAGFVVDYQPSYRLPGSGSDWQWNLRLRRRLEQVLAEREPDLVVFDGIHPYRALTHVLSAAGAPPSVWCRRPLWRADARSEALARVGAFDRVLEPGELAAAADRGPTAARREEAIEVPPIVYLGSGELLARERAAAELGLDPARPTALVSLGQGGATDRAVARVLGRLAAERELQVAVLQSSIGSTLRPPEGVVVLEATFPMSRYFACFDLAVAAAGYNAFHELIAFAVPTLFVPMPRLTDDQAARAAWAAGEGVALAVEGPVDGGLERELGRLLDPELRSGLAERCRRAFGPNGAERAAELVAGFAAGEWAGPDVRDRSRLNRWLRLSSHRVGPSLPLALGLTARDLLRNPERRSPRLVVLALEVGIGELLSGLERLEREHEVERSRIMVLTDSLEFAALRAAGVGFECLPPPEQARVLAPERDYRGFLRARLALIGSALAPVASAVSLDHGHEDLLHALRGEEGPYA